MPADRTHYFKDLRIELYGPNIFVDSVKAPVSTEARHCYLIRRDKRDVVGSCCSKFKEPWEVFKAYPGLDLFLKLVE